MKTTVSACCGAEIITPQDSFDHRNSCSKCNKVCNIKTHTNSPTEPTDTRKKRVYLTKNRMKALDLALTMDDILYEKHRRLVEILHAEQRKLSRMGNVIKVLQRKPEGIYVLQITDIKVCPEGQIVEVL